MDEMRTTRSPWRSWAAIAFVLVTLALIQACDSGKHTGPSSNTSLQLKLRRVGGAELQSDCTGTYSVSGPGVNIQNAPLPPDQISFQGQVGQTYTVSVQVTCKSGCTQSGSTTFTLQPGSNQAEIVLTCSNVLGVTCKPNPVAPNQDSICTCNFQSAGTPSFGWTGATPANGNQARFNSGSSGTVTCTVNGVATGSTTVTVSSPPAPPPPPPPPPPSQTAIVIQNQDGTFNLRAIFSGGPQAVPTINSLPPRHSATRNVQAGTYNVQILFDNDGFLNCTSDSVTVNPNQTQTRGYTFPESCD